MSTPAFTWQTTQGNRGILHFARRGQWQAGVIEQFDNEFVLSLAFTPPQGFSNYCYSNLEDAKQQFENAFEQFLSTAEIRLTLPALNMEWVEKHDRHYGMSGKLLIFVIHQDEGEWKFDCLLPFTRIDGDADYQKQWLEDKIPTRNMRGDPNNPWYGSDVIAYLQNKCELLLVAWLLQSAFMMRFDPATLPVGQKV